MASPTNTAEIKRREARSYGSVMNFEIIIPLQPGEGLISHGSIQFSSSNVVVFAVGLETMNNNNNYNNIKTILAILQ